MASGRTSALILRWTTFILLGFSLCTLISVPLMRSYGRTYFGSTFSSFSEPNAITSELNRNGAVVTRNMFHENCPDIAAILKSLQLTLVKAGNNVGVRRSLQIIQQTLDDIDKKAVAGGFSPTTSGQTTDRSFVENAIKVKKKETDRPLLVCPEVYNGTLYGYPFFYKGFVTRNCTSLPFNQVASIVLNTASYNQKYTSSYLEDIIKGIEDNYPGITVYVATSRTLTAWRHTKHKVNLRTRLFSKSQNPGEILNSLLRSVETPYVLVAQGLTHFTSDIALQRMVWVIDKLGAGAVGGAYRTSDGHWSMGCQQLTYTNYSLAYQAGYHSSVHECVYCSHTNGPFLLSRRVIGKIKFDESISSPVVLMYDFFLKLHQKRIRSLVCPDSMFHVLPTKAPTRGDWISLTKRWQISHLISDKQHHTHFNCYESGSNCDKAKGLVVSPCCLQKLSNMVKFIMNTCEDVGAICELQEGTLLSAVKMNKVFPWERDADLTFLTSNYSALAKAQDLFAKEGLILNMNGGLWCCADNRTAGGKMMVNTDGWHTEMYGQHLMDSEIMMSKGMKPTKIEFDGMWVNVPTNPGRHARNRYGREIYRHAQHWLAMGDTSGWINYDTSYASRFSECPQSGSHACLDQYKTDGNIQFQQWH